MENYLLNGAHFDLYYLNYPSEINVIIILFILLSEFFFHHMLTFLQIIYSVSKSHSSYWNCDSEQHLLYTNIYIMDATAVTAQAIQ